MAAKKNKLRYTHYFELLILLLIFGMFFMSVIFLVKEIPIRKSRISFPKTQNNNPYEFAQKEKKEVISIRLYKKKERELVTILQKKDPRKALDTLFVETKIDKNTLNMCHTLAHALGRSAYQKYKDVNQAFSYEEELCGSGYLHGVIEERIAQSKNIYQDLQTMCGLNAGSCVHGMGHGLMYYTENDLPKALTLCNTLITSRERTLCYEGVFMENFNTDQAIHPTKHRDEKNVLYPCTAQEAQYKSICYFYVADYYYLLNENDFVGALKVCDTVEQGYKNSCINGFGSRSMKRSISNPLKIEKICSGLSANEKTSCLDGMVGYFLVHNFSVSKAQTLCPLLKKENQPQCYTSIAQRSNFYPI